MSHWEHLQGKVKKGSFDLKMFVSTTLFPPLAKAKELRSWKNKYHHHFYSGGQLIMLWKYFPYCWNHTYKLYFSAQQITTALAEYRSKHFMSLGEGTSSTAKIEAVIAAKLFLLPELQVHSFAALQLAWSWRGCRKADLFARRVCSVCEALGQSHEVTVLQLSLKSLFHTLVGCGLHCSHTSSSECFLLLLTWAWAMKGSGAPRIRDETLFPSAWGSWLAFLSVWFARGLLLTLIYGPAFAM